MTSQQVTQKHSFWLYGIDLVRFIDNHIFFTVEFSDFAENVGLDGISPRKHPSSQLAKMLSGGLLLESLGSVWVMK